MTRNTSTAMIVLVAAWAGLLTAAAAPATQPAKELVLDLGDKVTLKLVQIPSGKFMMGSPETEKDRHKDEVQHEVTISKPFYMGITEVTQEQYEAVMEKNPSISKEAKNPVEQVDWYNAVEFCKKLSAKTGRTVQLPTEAQWEYACRAGSKARFCFGDSDTEFGDYAWYDKNFGSRNHPVGQKKPNAWGLYDMHGLMWEMTNSGNVLRGGALYVAPARCRAAYRFSVGKSLATQTIGFRVCLNLN